MQKDEILKLIEEAARTGQTELDLSGNYLAELPAEIGNVTNLTMLSLSGNQLIELPAEIGNLTNLTTLSLSDNHLSDLPSEIGNLTNLTTFSLSDNHFSDLLFEIGNLTNLTNLSLSDNHLSDLPAEIGNLTNLTTLYLNGNHLSALPSEIGNLTNLTDLYLYRNHLSALPFEIGNLTNLTTLSLSDNHLSDLPSEIGNLTNLTELYLYKNHLSDLPSEIGHLTNLTWLYLNGNHLSALPSEIGHLTNLTGLYLYGNHLSALPSEIGHLTNLTTLSLGDNHLSDLPFEIGQLTNLTGLYLYGNHLSALPSEIGHLTNLTTLSLSDNQLSALPSEIGHLTNLTTLSLSDNQLSALPSEIGHLTNLTTLYLNENHLSALPSEIEYLTNLTRLHLSGNYLSVLPSEIGHLTNLSELYLNGNQFSALPSEIGQLTNLSELYLNGNQFSALPSEIGHLTNLTTLFLSDNQLSALPSEIGHLTNLTRLYLDGNHLSVLPSEIGQLTNLVMLYLYENPLKSPPPEIIKQGVKAILEYLRHLPEKETLVNEAKMILVGQGDVGKTCLAKRLIYDEFIEDKTTEGIDILKWGITAPTDEKEEINLNVWDFGGQDIYHATHQFFLTKRSVYLLVWNARKSLDFEHIYYWLHTIEAFGEDSPIILVLSKLNERDDDLNMKDLREIFPQIVGLYRVDSEDGKGIPPLKDIISNTAWQLPHMQTPWIDSWFRVREKLEQHEKNWIGYSEFCKICHSEGLDKKQIDILDEYLHDLGVIIHFQDIKLQNMVILKPEWATNAVYKILDTDDVKERNGILLHSELGQIWDTGIYPQDVHPKLLDLMNKFELAYELPDEKSHLVAELLPKSEPAFEWDSTDNLHFYYRYDFLPAGVMTRFIVRLHRDLEDKSDGTQLFWREGAVLCWEDTHAFVKVKPSDKLIEIKINGSKKKELLAIIRRELDHINKSIKKVKITKEIPCSCSTECFYKFDYEDLLHAEKKGIETVQCQKNFEDVSLYLLLEGYERKEDRMKEIDEVSKEKKFNFNMNQIVVQRNVQTQKSNQELKIDIDIDVKIATYHEIQSDFEDFKDLLIELNPEFEKKLNEIGDSLDEVSADSENEKLVKPLNKLGRFLGKLGDAESDYSKMISVSKKGTEMAQKLGKTYNKLAQWIPALPVVPDLFLGKQ